jgi:hypothetical protein
MKEAAAMRPFLLGTWEVLYLQDWLNREDPQQSPPGPDQLDALR